ncbi:MAG TPA: DNA-binding transcriptional regulator [Caulifigura sp.]|nr:DNA-binding transcriptional regulator [Caulifigura sp.]
MHHTAHVALLIETSRAYGRGLLRGIVRYQREHGPWSIYFQPRGINDPAPGWLRNWKGDGILARVRDRKMASTIERTGIPCVDLRFAVPGLEMPAVGIDNTTIVRRALDHFLDRGFRRFAVCSYPEGQFAWMDVRTRLFCGLVSQAGFDCQVFTGSAEEDASPPAWELEQSQIAKWVSRLPKPVAIFAVNDDRGLQILDACRRASVHVPDEVSVLGVDNDEFLCGLSTPPLSSVSVNLETVGYRAAELLDGMMRHGVKPPAEPLLLPAGDVVARKSTDSLAIDDPELSKVVRYLREHACEGIRMTDITRATGMERRTLERRMKALFGRSPKDELMRIQIEEAKRLLASTELSIKAISMRTGFANSRYFTQVFRTRVGVAPGQFRHASRGKT